MFSVSKFGVVIRLPDVVVIDRQVSEMKQINDIGKTGKWNKGFPREKPVDESLQNKIFCMFVVLKR